MKIHKYTTFYFSILTEFALTANEALLMVLIDGLSKQKGRACYASKDNLAIIINVTPPTVYKAIDTLEERGLIIKKGLHPKYGTGLIGVSDKWLNFIEEIHSDLDEYWHVKNPRKNSET